MDWFEAITGFPEADYEATRRRLVVRDGRLVGENGRSFATGSLAMPSLDELRAGPVPAGRLRVRSVVGDVRQMHAEPEFAGALFQVASQFNLLEMTSPDITPEDGVARYAGDRTQGPACAMAAGAATIWRNYCVPVGGATGQTAGRQLDCLADLGGALAGVLGRPVQSLWDMENGYAFGTRDGLAAIAAHLDGLGEEGRDALRGLLRVGVHSDVDITDAAPPSSVSQAFCSALPVAYSRVEPEVWQRFARLVLDAAYEATLLAGAANARRGRSNIVLLTRLGGGAFGNADVWIDAAIRRALTLMRHADLDIRLVSFGRAPPSMVAIATAFD